MDAYVIVGNASAGKSSLVRALTGIRNQDQRLMAYAATGNFVLWAKDSSMQEARILPQDFIDTATLHRPDAILCTMWPRGCTSKGVSYPNCTGYLQEFIAAGWTIKPLVVLNGSSPPVLPELPATVTWSPFSNLRTTPFNELAASIRNHWNWK